MTIEKFEFLRNGSYSYRLCGDVVLCQVAIRSLDEEGNLVEKVSVDMAAGKSVEEFQAMDLVTHIDGEIPEGFFPEELFENVVNFDPAAEEYDVSAMRPIFMMDGAEGYYEDLKDKWELAQKQYFWGLRAYCPQMILTMVEFGEEENQEEEIYEEIADFSEEEWEEEPVIGSFRGEPVYAFDDEIPFDKWDAWANCHIHTAGQLVDGTVIYEDELD